MIDHCMENYYSISGSFLLADCGVMRFVLDF